MVLIVNEERVLVSFGFLSLSSLAEILLKPCLSIVISFFILFNKNKTGPLILSSKMLYSIFAKAC